MYKMLTRLLARRISYNQEEHSLVPAEQKECHIESKGYKDLLLVSKQVFQDCRKRRKDLNIAWIIKRHFIMIHITG